MPKKILLFAIAAVLSIPSAANAVPIKRITGSNGAILSVNKVSNLKSGDALTITGAHFDETVGIYVAMCKVVPKTDLPTPCGGGIDKTGASKSSVWISSNAPAYGAGLAKPYGVGGRFTVGIKVSPIIGKLDCRKIACAIYVRADHLRTDDRTYDLHIPLTFAK